MNQLAEVSDMLDKDIITKALSIQDMKEKKSYFEDNNQTKLAKLINLKKNLSQTKQNQENLFDRNVALREKFNTFDGDSKEESALVSEESKAFFKKLGLKALIEVVAPSNYEQNLVQLKLQFLEDKNYHATFVYDPVTEDYDLIEVNPEHPRFRQLQDFLRQTKDIQGFLFNFRDLMLKSVKNEH